MVIAEPAEHEVGGLSAERELGLAPFESRSQLHEGEREGSRSCVSKSIRRNDDPLGCDAEGRRQNGIHAAIGLVRQDVVARPASGALRRRGAMQKQFKARVTYRGEIMPKLGKSETTARRIRAAIPYCQASHPPAPHLAAQHIPHAP